MAIQEFIAKTYRVKSSGIQSLRPIVVCVDGFTMSVQASDFHYCSPRKNGLNNYTRFEMVFPSQMEKLLFPYAESKNTQTDTVYAYVQEDIVKKVIKKHGGIKE